MSNIRDFEYVVEIAQYGSISKAANSLYVSQPTLTKFLQKLESNLGVPLFHRVGKKFMPTPAGEIYIKKAKEIIKLNSQIEQSIGDIVSNRKGNIRLGVTAGRSPYIINKVLPQFVKKYPYVELIIEIQHIGKIIKMLTDNELDIALTSYTSKQPMLNYLTIGHDELVIAASKDLGLSRFAKENSRSKYPLLPTEIWRDYSFMLTTDQSYSAVLAKEYFKYTETLPHMLGKVQDIRGLIEAVESKACLSMFISVPLKENSNIEYFSLENSVVPKQDVAIVTRQWTYVSSAQQYLNDIIKDTYNL